MQPPVWTGVRFVRGERWDVQVRWEEWEAGDRLLVWDTRFNNILCEGDRVVVGRTAGDSGDLVCERP